MTNVRVSPEAAVEPGVRSPADLAVAGGVALAAPAGDAGAHLLAIGRSALLALMEMMPRAVWRGFKGSFAGFFLMGLFGLAIAALGAAASAFGWAPQPRWLVLVNLGWVPLVFAIGGGYAGATHGSLSAVAEEIERRGLAARLFAVVKPVCLAVARKARGQGTGGGGMPAGGLAADLRGALEQRLDEDRPQRPATLGERAEVYLANRSRRILCLSVLRAVVTAKDREAAIQEMETLGVRQLTMILTDTIEDLFSMQVSLSAALALLAAAAPAIVYAVIR